MSDERKYQILKYASVIALVVTLGLYAIFHYMDSRNSFHDLSEMKESLKMQIDQGITFYGESDDEEESSDLFDPLDTFFGDSEKVVEYIFSTAMLGEIDLFYYNFDPNVYAADFPDIEKADQQRKALFNRLTRNSKLENIRILSMGPDAATFEQIVKVELIYKDDKRFKTSFRLKKIGDEHHHNENWYISTSMYEIVQPITTL